MEHKNERIDVDGLPLDENGLPICCQVCDTIRGPFILTPAGRYCHACKPDHVGVKCPNAGPGRYEGNRAPCLTAVLEASSCEGFSDRDAGDVEYGEAVSIFYDMTETRFRDSRGPEEAETEYSCATCGHASVQHQDFGRCDVTDCDCYAYVPTEDDS